MGNMIYTAEFDKVKTEFLIDTLATNGTFAKGEGFNTPDAFMNALVKDISQWVGLEKNNIVSVDEIDMNTGKILGKRKYKLNLSFDFIKVEEKEPPIDPQLEQLFMRNFEEIDYYE